MLIWTDQDSREYCKKPGVEQVDGSWFCAGCLPSVKAQYAIRREREVNQIQINKYGELLGQYGKYEEHRNIGTCVHGHCHGFVDRFVISETHAALCCKNCGLRVRIPRNIETWSQLMQYFRARLARQKGKGANT